MWYNGRVDNVQSIERAFLLLEEISRTEVGVTELAEQADLPKSTVARILNTLVEVGAVERMEPDSVYRIGPKVFNLSAGRGMTVHLTARARPHLRMLAREIGEDAGLSVPDGHRVHYIAQEDAQNDVSVRDWTGTLLPMHVVPSGLVVLSEWPPAQLDLYLERGLEGYTPFTVTDPEQLRTRLVGIREAGYAWVREEFAEGISSVAAPVHDGQQRVLGALHVHGPSYRFPDGGEDEEIARLVADAAGRVSAAMNN